MDLQVKVLNIDYSVIATSNSQDDKNDHFIQRKAELDSIFCFDSVDGLNKDARHGKVGDKECGSDW